MRRRKRVYNNDFMKSLNKKKRTRGDKTNVQVEINTGKVIRMKKALKKDGLKIVDLFDQTIDSYLEHKEKSK